MSEDQLQALIQMASSSPSTTAGNRSKAGGTTSSAAKSGAHHVHNNPGGSATTDPAEEDQPGDMTMVLGEDGTLKLVDQEGTEYLVCLAHSSLPVMKNPSRLLF